MWLRVSRWKPVVSTLLFFGFLFIPAFASCQITISPSTLNFGSVLLGSSSTLALTLSNSSRGPLVISQATLAGGAFSLAGPTLPLTLESRQSAQFLVTFTPQTAGSVTGSLSVASEYSGRNGWRERTSTITVALSGTAASPGYLSPSVSGLNFGNTLVGSSQTLSVILTNSGGSSVSISQAAVTGNGFNLGTLALPLTVAAGQTVTMSIAFAPATTGSSSGALMVTSNASDSAVSLSLTGNGTSAGQITLTPASLSFGDVDLGSTESLGGTITASGSNLTISSVSSTSSQFALSGLTLPLTIAAGQSAPFTITFTPQASGAVSGSFSFVSNASNSPDVESATGTGQTIQYTVSLSWNASASTVAGYNVYRAAASNGPYTKLDASLDTATTYADTTVQSGQTYYYVTTAVNSAGVESGYSNQVTAQIPTP
jgi:Abnormal spindle-like microcephaly-assoc'd, ASPM-SPD-2-Hydin